MRKTCFWISASLALALACGCKSKQTSESKQPEETKQPAQPAPAQPTPAAKPPEPAPATGSSAAAAVEMGTVTCKDVQNDVCVGSTDTFDANVPVVHMSYTTADLPKAGDTYKIQWIAEDVGKAAPANTVIATVDQPVKDIPAGAKSYTVNSHLTKPTKGWPVGKYRVEVKLGDKLATTAHFSIH